MDDDVRVHVAQAVHNSRTPGSSPACCHLPSRDIASGALAAAWARPPADHPRPGCTHEWIAEMATFEPHRVAVVDDVGELTYGELESRANQLARHLQSRGVGREARVAVCMSRTCDMLVALLATWKAGAAYVPLDPEYPPARIAAIIEDASPILAITETGIATCLPSALPTVLLDAARSTIALLPSHPLECSSTTSDLAYVIFTSGSTGRPKGVEIEHGSLANLLHSMRRRPRMDARDIVLTVTTISFDMAVPDLYLPLTVGARLVIAPRAVARNARALANALERSGATMFQATPVAWRTLLDAGWTNPRRIKMLCGAEALPSALAADLLATGGQLWNMYGPTETTVWSSVDRVTDASAHALVPIGPPIDNTTFHVRLENGELAPPDVEGELCIGGAGVARSYLARPDLTAEKFIRAPGQAGSRIYRTGDLVRPRSDGRFDFLGRIDHQVKLRGHRIELGEIESVIREVSLVREAVVILHDDPRAGAQLVAYLWTGTNPGMAAAALRELLRARLPDYMIPSVFLSLDTLPLTLNGKVDRQALPSPAQTVSGREAVAPRNDVETRLLDIWRDVLGSRTIGVTDRFNEVGGHSLAAAQLFSRITRDFGRELQLATMLTHDTVEKLAGLLRRPAEEDEWNCIVPFTTVADGVPIFCPHAQTGYVLIYQHFAREVASRHPVYGIAARGNWREQMPQETIGEMVEYYIGEILKVRPQGPYIFFAVSVGGWIALELAREMKRRGHEVQMLAMYDTEGPGYPRYTPYGRVAKWVCEHGGVPLEQVRKLFAVDPQYGRSIRTVYWNLQFQLRWWIENTRRDHLYRKYRNENPPLDFKMPRKLSRFRLACQRVVSRHDVGFYHGKITLLRAEGQPRGIYSDGTNGWRDRCSALEIHEIPGGHTSGMKQPGVSQLARTFLECLDRDIGTKAPVKPPTAGDDVVRESCTQHSTRVLETSPGLVTVNW